MASSAVPAWLASVGCVDDLVAGVAQRIVARGSNGAPMSALRSPTVAAVAMTTTERLAAAIETARANLGVDWAELSRRSGVYPKHAYVAWELHALAKALNVDMLDLLDGTVQSVGPMLWCEPRRPR